MNTTDTGFTLYLLTMCFGLCVVAGVGVGLDFEGFAQGVVTGACYVILHMLGDAFLIGGR